MDRTSCTLRVEGLDCPVEAGVLRDALGGSPGVDRLDFDLIHGTMTVHHDPSSTNPAELLRLVGGKAGMAATLVEAGRPPAPVVEEVGPPWYVRERSTIGAGLALAAGVGLGYAGLSRGALACYVIAVACGGVALFPHAIKSARRGRFDVHLLMGLAVVGAVALGQWDEAATVAFLFGLSEALESLSVRRSRFAIRALLDVAPEEAERIGSDGSVAPVPADRVVAGDRLRVRAGARVPVDGTVVSGRSSVDQKAITGESRPVAREPGDAVHAGSINGEGALEILATSALGDALISRIVERVRAAQANRAPLERTIGRFASIYTPIVVALASAIAIVPPLVSLASGGASYWTIWLNKALVVLVVACPCALVIATPVAVAAALASAARRGILIKGGEYLEEFGRLRALAFDKTGTLTRGEPAVVEVVPAGVGGDDSELLRIAAALGEQGGHVLGRAIARHARALRIDVPSADSYEAVPGLGAIGRVGSIRYHIGSHRFMDETGLCAPEFHDSLDRLESVEGGGETSVAVAAATGPIGFIRLADQPRPEAAAVVSELATLGIKAFMLTGDHAAAAAPVARALGIADPEAGLLPADKADRIAALIAEHGATGMVGDGVNDTPALAAARVSVSLGGLSSPAAIETADIVLMADDLRALPWLVRHSRATLAMIRQNIAFALATKALVMALAVAGVATLWMAILADVGTTLLVTANALRLLRPRA